MGELGKKIAWDFIELFVPFCIFYFLIPEIATSLTYATSINHIYKDINNVAPLVIYLLAFLGIVWLRLYNKREKRNWFYALSLIFLLTIATGIIIYNKNILLVQPYNSPNEFCEVFILYWGLTLLVSILGKAIPIGIEQMNTNSKRN